MDFNNVEAQGGKPNEDTNTNANADAYTPKPQTLQHVRYEGRSFPTELCQRAAGTAHTYPCAHMHEHGGGDG